MAVAALGLLGLLEFAQGQLPLLIILGLGLSWWGVGQLHNLVGKIAKFINTLEKN